MSAGVCAIVWLVIVAGIGASCWAFYRQGRFNGYLTGYDVGHEAGQRDIVKKINAIKQRGQAVEASIDSMAERAIREIRQLSLDSGRSGREWRP